MLCQTCRKRDALVFISTRLSSALGTRQKPDKRFCRQCADKHYVRAGMNASRDLIRLSNFYRSKLYDLLEKQHPEAFDNSTAEACRKGSNLMRRFLRANLKKDNMKVSGDALEMLCIDFFSSRHFYDRVQKIKARSG